MRLKRIALTTLCLLSLSAPAGAVTTSQATLDAARRQVAETPHSADAHFELAMNYARTPFLEEGWAALKQVQVIDPVYAAKAVSRYEALIHANPQDTEAHFRLAFAYYFQGDKPQARRQLEQIIAITPVDPWAYNYLGFLQAEAGQLEQATANWQRALGYDPDNAVAHYLIGQAFYRQGRFMQAASSLATALRLRAGTALKP